MEDLSAAAPTTTVDFDYPTMKPDDVARFSHMECMEERRLRGAIRVFSGCEAGERAEMFFAHTVDMDSHDFQPSGDGVFRPEDRPELRNMTVGMGPGQVPPLMIKIMGEGTKATDAQFEQKIGWTNAER